MHERKWTEADLQLLYPSTPQLRTMQTYSTVYIDLPLGRVPVKLPKDADTDKAMYLLHKELYFHHLDHNQKEPLYNTASVILFECEESWAVDYACWVRGTPYPKGALLKPVIYNDEPVLTKYLVVGKQKERVNTYLVRSKRDGQYYTMEILESKKESDRESIDIYIQQLKTLQHPFLANLREVFQTSSKTYLIFDHIAMLIGLQQSSETVTQEWNLQQIKTCLIETLFALVFIEQRNISVSNSKWVKLGISKQGHILLKNDSIQHLYKEESLEQPVFNALETLLMLLDKICPEDIGQRDGLIVDFFQFLHFLYEQDKTSLKEVMPHQFVAQFVSHQVLGMGMPKITLPQQIDLTAQWVSTSKTKTEALYREFEKAGIDYTTYYSNEAYQVSPQSQFLKQYQIERTPRDSHRQRKSVRNKDSSQKRRQTNPETHPTCDISHKRKKHRRLIKSSPYEQILRGSPSYAHYRRVL